MQSITKPNRNKALSIVTHGFSIFYINIPQSKLKNLMRELHSVLKVVGKQFIAVTKLDEIWTDIKNKVKITFDKASLKLAIDLLLDNLFLLIW